MGATLARSDIFRRKGVCVSESVPTGEAFEIAGADGEVIRGNVHLPSGAPDGRVPVVLVLHGFKGYKDYGFFPFLTARIAEGGLAAVRFNFSHSGIDLDPSTFGRPDLFERDSWSKQLADVAAVIAALPTLPGGQRMDLDRLGVVGHSRGGVVTLLAAGSDDRIKAAVALSAPSSADMPEEAKHVIREQGYVVSPSSRTGQDLRIGRAWLDDLEQNADRLDVLASVARITAPLMIVHGTADASAPVACAERIANAYAGTPETLLLEGASHTFDCANPFTGPSEALNQLIARVCAFLQAHLV